jgi:hypothetical protein
LIDTGLYCIEAVLIGPDVRAAALLAVEPKLLAAARWRVKDSHDSDGFTPHVQTLIAMADSILAALAFDSVLEGGA